jgi:hypothetical protein
MVMNVKITVLWNVTSVVWYKGTNISEKHPASTYPEDGDSKLLSNIGTFLKDDTAFHRRRELTVLIIFLW